MLFDLGAIGALTRPGFVADPLTGAVTLAASLPALVRLLRH